MRKDDERWTRRILGLEPSCYGCIVQYNTTAVGLISVGPVLVRMTFGLPVLMQTPDIGFRLACMMFKKCFKTQVTGMYDFVDQNGLSGTYIVP